jgi:hypothetical protein
MKYYILFVVLLFISCRKEEDRQICISGTIVYAGDPAVDGLSWTLQEENTTYVLKNLPDAFKQTGKSVTACLTRTEERVPCICNYVYYRVESIR